MNHPSARPAIDARREIFRVLTADLGRTLARDAGRTWSAGELLGAASTLHARFQNNRGPVGIACARSGSVLAALVAAWAVKRQAILVDPALRKEIDTLRSLRPGVEIFTDRGESNDGRTSIADDLERCAAPSAPPPWLTLPNDGEPFAALFTSGSEGDPKIVERTGAQFYRQAEALAGLLDVPAPCTVLSFVPPYHLLGFFYGIVLPLVLDGETILATETTAPAMLQALNAHHPHLVIGSATHYRFLVRAQPPSTVPPSALPRIYLSSGAPLDPATADAFPSRFGTAVREFYGSTETGGVAWRRWPEPYQPMPNVACRIDPESARLEVQSEWAGGAGTWMATGDAAEPAGAGRFRLLGRLGHMVKVGGKRFSSLEIEHALQVMPGILEVAVIPYQRYGEQAVAAVVAIENGRAIDEVSIREYLDARLARFKVPRMIRFVDALPRASHAKVDYQALRRIVAGD